MKAKQRRALRKPLPPETGFVRLHRVYRCFLGTRQGLKIWAVQGDEIFWKIYPQFILGGNDQRYRWNPFGEILLDNRQALVEYRYTLAHEILERRLMLEFGWSYNRAHDEALKLEKSMRNRDEALAGRHAQQVNKVREQNGEAPLPERVYLQFFGIRKGLKVWIVDGANVRHKLDGDFTEAGHGLKNSYVPAGEIWLDSTMWIEHVLYGLGKELAERKLMAAGKSYDDAYTSALGIVLAERERQARLVRNHERKLPPMRRGDRDRGGRPRR